MKEQLEYQNYLRKMMEDNIRLSSKPIYNTMPSQQEENWRVQVRDWWYSVQDLLAEKDLSLSERKRVELEKIIISLTQAHKVEMEESIRKERAKIALELNNFSQRYPEFGVSMEIQDDGEYIFNIEVK